MVLPALEVVPQQEVEHLCRALHVLRHDPDEPPSLRIHGGEPHHVRVVFAQALGPVDLVLFALQGLYNVRFFLVGVGKPGLVAAVDLEEGRFRDVYIALLDEGGGQAVEHGQNHRPRRHRCR